MAYQSLYRRYRSKTFQELVGQDHIVTALKNAVTENRVGHAYLFSGPRGTGKTSTARILGKALIVLTCKKAVSHVVNVTLAPRSQMELRMIFKNLMLPQTMELRL